VTLRPREPLSAVLLMAALSSAANADGLALALVPELLVRGAGPSASDTVSPLPEGGTITQNAYDNLYFGLKYALASGWNQQYEGPPPSESGFYVLAQIEPADRGRRSIEGHALIVAQDMFFGTTLAASAAELINFSREHLNPEFQVERQPGPVRIAHHDFIRFDYRSPVSQLHWSVLATQVRCHTVEFIFTGRDASHLARMVKALDALELSDPGAPVCIKDFANPENMITREEPILPQPRFNPIPVRIIVGTDGTVQHIHFISAFPEQVRNVADALAQWRFKPYRLNGQAVAVETGIMFGRAPSVQAQNAP
jgi:hypothetical protein